MISNNIYTKSSQDHSPPKTENATFTGPSPGTVSVASMHVVWHIISSAGGTHPSHPAGTDLSICLPCLAMVSINKYSKKRRPCKIIHQGPVYTCSVNSNRFFMELNSSALIRIMIACPVSLTCLNSHEGVRLSILSIAQVGSRTRCSQNLHISPWKHTANPPPISSCASQCHWRTLLGSSELRHSQPGGSWNNQAHLALYKETMLASPLVRENLCTTSWVFLTTDNNNS